MVSKNSIPMEVEVTIEAASGEPKSRPRFHVLAYTGGALQVNNIPLPIVIDLQGLEYESSIIANVDHDKSQRVGHVTAKNKTTTSLELSGVISGTGPAAQEVIDNAANGFPWKASVEARPIGEPELIKAGQKVTVNGQTFVGPLLVARKSQLYGFAFLSRGADSNTSVTIAAGAAHSSNEKELDMDFAKYIEAAGFDPATINEKQKTHLQKSYDAEIKAAAAIGKPDVIAVPKFDIDELKAAYAQHEATIEGSVFKYQGQVDAPKLAEIKASALQSAVALKRQAIEKEWSALQFEVHAGKAASAVEVELIRAERPKGPAIHATSKNITGQVIEAAMCQQLRIDGHEKQYKDEVLQAAHSEFHGRIGLQEMLVMAASMNGMVIRPGERVHDGNLYDVLAYAAPPRAMRIHAAASTLSLPGIFSNVANKELLLGYTEEDNSWAEIASVKTNTDFKVHTSYRMLDNMEYESLSDDGRIKHGTLGEVSYTRSLDTYAKMFALTRKDIINDDLSAFDDLRNRLGRGAKKKFNKLFWTKWLNNSSFFTAARGNYITGAATTLLTDGVGLETAILAFDALKTPTADGEKKIGANVGGQASMILHPPQLQFAADRIYQSTNIGGGTTVANANIHAGKYKPVKCTFLSDTSLANYSTTAWYLLRPKTELAGITVSFLNGMQTPTVQTAEADFDQLGVQFRGYHDFGMDLAEYLCGVKVKGAA